MIKYRLGCDHGHEFESWFRSGAAFEEQAKQLLISCPHCLSSVVDRVPMAPAVIGSTKKQPQGASMLSAVATSATPEARQLMDELRQLKRKLIETSDYVGANFAEEARKIHFGESDERSIYGEATLDEASDLHDDGIAFGILPPLPEEQN